MFNLFKKKQNLISPISGKVIPLSQVPDEAFSSKLVGDGVAIDTTGDTVVAPCSGTISLILESKHAFGMILDNGVEILVHVGIDTVTLKGEGFQALAKTGDTVKAGDPILKIDRNVFIEKNISLITPILITNPDILKELKVYEGKNCVAGKDVVLEYKL